MSLEVAVLRSRPVAILVVALVAGACGATPPSPDPSPTVATSSPGSPTSTPRSASTAATTPVVTPTPAATSLDPAAVGPPAALLAAEGGDPVAGSLGTYTWADTGSDSPWLPGAPIVVGAGEPLAVSFEPAIPVDSWAARLVPAGSDGPAGAVALGQGVGRPAFSAPGVGAWTVELRVSFAAGTGTASWFWRLDVR